MTLKVSGKQFPSPSILMASNTQTNTTAYPWDRWSQLPKEERDAELKEAVKENASFDDDHAVGHHGTRPPFPYFDFVQTEEIDQPCYTDFIVQRETQKQDVTADASDYDWFQMHHDDGIMDGYLDVGDDGLPAGSHELSSVEPLIGLASDQREVSHGFAPNPFGASGLPSDSYAYGNHPSLGHVVGSHAGPSAVWASRADAGAPGSHSLIPIEPSNFIGGESPHCPGQDNAACATLDQVLVPTVDPGQSTNQPVLA